MEEKYLFFDTFTVDNRGKKNFNNNFHNINLIIDLDSIKVQRSSNIIIYPD